MKSVKMKRAGRRCVCVCVWRLPEHHEIRQNETARLPLIICPDLVHHRVAYPLAFGRKLPHESVRRQHAPWTHAETHTRSCARTSTHMHTHTLTQEHTQANTRTHTAHKHTHGHTHTNTHTHRCKHAHKNDEQTNRPRKVGRQGSEDVDM